MVNFCDFVEVYCLFTPLTFNNKKDIIIIVKNTLHKGRLEIMLKKLLCLMLVLACSFSLFACQNGESANIPDGDEDNINNPGDNGSGDGDEGETPAGPGFVDDKVELEPSECYSYIALVNNSNPNVITTKETVVSRLGNLTSTYKTYINGEEDYTFEYLYERFNVIGEGNDIKYSVPANGEFGTVYYKNGSYSYDGKNWTTSSPDSNILNVKFTLTRENLDKARKLTETADGSLIIETSAAEAEKILGVKIPTKTNVAITLVSNGLRLWKIVVEYSQEANSVLLETSYTYEQIKNED